MILLTLVPIVHLFIVWWLFKGIDQSSDNISDKKGFPIFLSFLFLSSIVYSLITNDNSSSNLIESPAKSEKKSKSTNISQPSISQSSKYSGSHSGSWEGYLLNQYNNGSAQFSVQSNGRASLILSGRFSATHNGRVKGAYFITDKGERCSIVDLGGGRFKIVLIWTGVNVDVYFSKTQSSSTQLSGQAYESCTSNEAKSFAIKRASINGTVTSAEVSDLGNNKWGVTCVVNTRIGVKVFMNVVKCNYGSYELLSSNIL